MDIFKFIVYSPEMNINSYQWSEDFILKTNLTWNWVFKTATYF